MIDNKNNNYNDSNTIICRCEDITLAEVKKAIAQGHNTIDDIKRSTRAGMGPCHGHTCGALIAQEISRQSSTPMREIRIPTSRPLTKPVKLGSFAKSKQQTTGSADDSLNPNTTKGGAGR